MMVAIHTTTLIIKLVIINKHKDGIGSEIVGKSSDIIVRKTVSANNVVVTTRKMNIILPKTQ
jgi:preprotein translocase subunit SecG